MLALAIRTLISAAGLMAIAHLSGGAISVRNYVGAIIAALLLGPANGVVKPILFTIANAMTCVLSCLTLGLWSLVLSWLINGFLFYEGGQAKIGLVVHGFWPAFWGALALSVVNALASVFTRTDKERE